MSNLKIFHNNKQELDEIVRWKVPTFHQGKSCYVAIQAYDPGRGKMRTKKIMLNRIKGRKAQKEYGNNLIKRLISRLQDGWNPWVESIKSESYTPFADVCDKYREYIYKMMNEHNMREETVKSYISRLNILQCWVESNKKDIEYSYQFGKASVSEFLDYVYIDRNNTIQTRNNYVEWIKTFCKYLHDRNYVSSDPSEHLSSIKSREKKNRDVIPDSVLKEIKDYLVIKNKNYLLACEIRHYLFVRPNEMTNIRISDFSVYKKTMSLHGDHTKNHQDAVITVPDCVLKTMIDIGIFNYPGQYYLFSDGFLPGTKKKSSKMFRDYWGKMRKELGFSSRYKFYSLKDTGITNMIKANTDILSVRDQARHSSVLITDMYTPKDIKEANDVIVNYDGSL